nr:hypothetical protein [uncultured Noviherbaspirillum sp.]
MVKVLVAIRPEDLDVMRRVFGDEFEVINCITLGDAKAALTDDLALIACGVHFDDGRMFDLLKMVKEDPQLQAIPFWGILRDEGLLSSAITRGIRTAMKSMGASGLFNLSQLNAGSDEDAAFQNLRSAIRQSVSGKAG